MNGDLGCTAFLLRGLVVLGAVGLGSACAEGEAASSTDVDASFADAGGEVDASDGAGAGGTGGRAGAAGGGGRPAAGSGGRAGTAGGGGRLAAGSGGRPAAGSGAGAGGQGGGSAGSSGSAGSAGSPGGQGTPPATWQEHWFEHDRNLMLVDHNDWVALYFDEDVAREESAWLLPFMTRVWQYTVTHYGQFTDGQRDGRLYAIYHQGRYSGGHPSTYFDASHDHRNVSDVGPGPFPDGSYAISTHEVAHIVEGASRGVHGSPAFGLWGDSKWAEFFQYDLYVGLGETEEAERVFDEFSAKSDDFPRPDTHWFRDWFYPLWRDHGHVEVMADYFRLLSQHYRKNGDNYAGDMNFGEYVHFMSGAAGTDLKEQATRAFGWSDAREAELTAAKADYPDVEY